MKLLPGSPHPLGATWDGEGVNFALYSEHAESVELCLFDDHDAETRLLLPRRTAFVWHGYIQGLLPGQRYAYRVHGPYVPERGLRFNPNVLLLDPYAKAVDGTERWSEGCFAYELGHPDGDLRMSTTDQRGAPRGVVIDTSFDWENDEPLRTPFHRTVIYEAHVRGLTMLHPEVPELLRGTYAGVAHPAVINYLQELGITAIELLPVHSFVDDQFLLEKGLRNYWGYNTVGFFAPDVRYRSGKELGSEVREFKEMVKALHRAGIEVILDVVYNHTAEGNHLGPTFHFKGIDNPTYYRLVPGDPRFYFDYTGTGNTLNVRHPQVLAVIMDSLRYWADEMHVDGFRFDLASALARQLHEVDQLSSFFTSIHHAPSLAPLKLIAEPWDVGEGGYQVGNFPVRWAEWNGKFRDAVRALFRGEGGKAAEIGYRLTGSSDLYEASGRSPSASINLVTAHDGFTLNDLVSYERKRNEANGEGNRDGSEHEHSFNCGVEGPTDDPHVLALRERQKRNLLAMLLLSQGTPMIVAGDEFGRTQRGNNNAYCQDNEISWLHWDWGARQTALFEFVKRLLRIRRDHPALHRSKFFQGRDIHAAGYRDLLWFRHDGQEMTEEDWHNPSTESLVMFLAGRGIDDVDEQGRPLVDDNLLLVLNASPYDLAFTIPQLEAVREPWQLLVDTADDGAKERRAPGQVTRLVAHSLKCFRAPSRVIRAGGSVHTLNATYRLQLHKDFGFQAAREVAGYLAELGVTDLYLSPIMQAAPGSTHGYDVVDTTSLHADLGDQADFDALHARLEELGLGLLVDWVPNHMGIARGNPLWDDVLENGRSSLCADYFDIDWSPARRDLEGRVLLPILGDHYGPELERGHLRLTWERERFAVAYFDKRFPLAPETWIPLLSHALAEAGLAPDGASHIELESILSALHHLPPRSAHDDAARTERARESRVIKQRLARLTRETPALEEAIARTVEAMNGTPGVGTSFDRLDELLSKQSYRLAFWRVASEEINYRRFFDINELAAVRMEVPGLFESAHTLLFRLIDDRKVQALRLDHVDGLYDPQGYFEALQRRFFVPPTDPGAPRGPDDLARPLPILVEKILESGEQLPERWPVDGTTGYEFYNAVLGLWVDAHAEAALTQAYRQFTGDRLRFRDHVYEAKLRLLRETFGSEIQMLTRALARIAAESRKWRDLTETSLKRALIATMASFSVYRTYLREGEPASYEDERRILSAIAEARRAAPNLPPAVFEFLEELLLLRAQASEQERGEHARFALRFQQLTGPVMAKAVEDTAFYRYHRLICLNEVGGSPGRFGASVESFHRQNAERVRSWPLSMITTATHDTKRGEDAAARLAVLSEIPEAFQQALQSLSELAVSARTQLDGQAAPTRRTEYLFYQALIGAYPHGWDGQQNRGAFAERLVSYMRKACREGKLETSWTSQDLAYEEALERFVRQLLGDATFMASLRGFCEGISPYGALNGLAQALLRLCAPGVCDTYQGAELWNQSLVDPDNRRPVDFERRARLLAALRRGAEGNPRALCKELLEHYADGRIKLFVTHSVLKLRRSQRALFLYGDYEGLPGGDHVVAFTRSMGTQRLICLAPRFARRLTEGKTPWPLGPVWRDHSLHVPYPGEYRNVFTGEVLRISGELRLADALAHFPVALFVRSLAEEEDGHD